MKFFENLKAKESLLINWILIIFALFILMMVIVIIVGYIIDKRKKYDSKELSKKIRVRTSSMNIGGGQELYAPIWIWQTRKKRLLGNLLRKKASTNYYYPKNILTKPRSTRFPLRREVWVILT